VKQGLEKYSFLDKQIDKLVKQATSASKGSYFNGAGRGKLTKGKARSCPILDK
jgi:hypothetical protein